ncbi:MAG: hypothetical protein AB2L12_15830 [Smithellaceae bacterium]
MAEEKEGQAGKTSYGKAGVTRDSISLRFWWISAAISG